MKRGTVVLSWMMTSSRHLIKGTNWKLKIKMVLTSAYKSQHWTTTVLEDLNGGNHSSSTGSKVPHLYQSWLKGLPLSRNNNTIQYNSSIGFTASRSHQATTHYWLVSNSRTAVVLIVALLKTKQSCCKPSAFYFIPARQNYLFSLFLLRPLRDHMAPPLLCPLWD